MNKEKINEIIKTLDKIGWEYNGFDHSNLEFCFMNENKACNWIDYVSLSYFGFRATRIKKINENFPIHISSLEFDLFVKLYNHMRETRRGLPLDLAKRQKKFDNYYKFEMGDTYCTFENGVLSCCVNENE